MVSAKDALDIILSSVSTTETEGLDLCEVHGRVLAETVVATENIPPFDNSAMDGYAVRAAAVMNVPVILDVVGEVSAGQVYSRELPLGEAVRIMTGGQIPRAADAVVQVEWTEELEKNKVRVHRAVKPGHNIRRAGEDISTGQVVLETGRGIRAAELGVLASLGKKEVLVYRIPNVAYLATGNELIEIDEPLAPGKIRSSNSYTLDALVKETGAHPVDLGIARDNEDDLRVKLHQGLKSDALVTSGGVSVGQYDLVQKIMKRLGVVIKLWKVNIKPGMPFLFGLYKSTPVFGLPGNPVSTMVTFLQFVRPALRKMMGVRFPERTIRLRAELVEEISRRDGKRHFIRGFVETQNGALRVRTTGSQSSAVLTSLVKANCLIIVPEETESLKKGDVVEVELL